MSSSAILGKLGSFLCFKFLLNWEQHSPGQNQSFHCGWKEFCPEFLRVQTSSSRLGLNYPVFLLGLSWSGGKFIPSWAHRTFPISQSPAATGISWLFSFLPPSTTQGGWRITQKERSCWVQLVLRLNSPSQGEFLLECRISQTQPRISCQCRGWVCQEVKNKQQRATKE